MHAPFTSVCDCDVEQRIRLELAVYESPDGAAFLSVARVYRLDQEMLYTCGIFDATVYSFRLKILIREVDCMIIAISWYSITSTLLAFAR
jgi:hypothetical protein